MNRGEQISKMLGLHWDDHTQKSQVFYLDELCLQAYKLRYNEVSKEIYIIGERNRYNPEYHGWTRETYEYSPTLEALLGGKLKPITEKYEPTLGELITRERKQEETE